MTIGYVIRALKNSLSSLEQILKLASLISIAALVWLRAKLKTKTYLIEDCFWTSFENNLSAGGLVLSRFKRNLMETTVKKKQV